MAGMVLDAYLRISHGLVEGLRCLGIAAEEAPGTNRAGPNVSAACFEVPSAYEIVAGGRKLLGSAQHRNSAVVLQHGSLPLTGDLTRLVDCLAFAQPDQREALRESLAGHATTVEEIAGRTVTLQEAAAAMIEGFQTALQVALVPAELSSTERGWAAELARAKYGQTEWTARL
jgi:lipoate-protein ligase A